MDWYLFFASMFSFFFGTWYGKQEYKKSREKYKFDCYLCGYIDKKFTVTSNSSAMIAVFEKDHLDNVHSFGRKS